MSTTSIALWLLIVVYLGTMFLIFLTAKVYLAYSDRESKLLLEGMLIGNMLSAAFCVVQKCL